MLRPTALTLALIALAGCADPLRDVARLGDVDVADPAPVVEAVAAPQETDDQTGFFQRLMRKREVGPVAPEAGQETAEETAEAGVAVETDDIVAAEAAVEKPRFRLFGRRAATVEDPVDEPEAESEAMIEQAALTSDDAQAGDKQEATPRRGLFGAGKAARLTGPDARDAAPGEVLPFGEVARACHVKRGDLGREVAQYPERGAKYRVYDSAPGTLGLHTFYVTGFKDGCPRQFTAALAVFGSPDMYEALRYGLPANARSKKPTDTAYEKVKSKVCGVGRTKPCGAKIGRLEKTTVFLSLYNRFEGAQSWTNLLLSDGTVVAKDVEG